MSKLTCFAICAILSVSFTQTAFAQYRGGGDRNVRGGNDNWEQLGCIHVGRRADRDVISVGKREGRYSAIRLAVSGNDVNIEDLTVVYGNGKPDELRVRDVIREGGQTRAIDLQGGDRFIQRIEITSRRDGKGRDGKGRDFKDRDYTDRRGRGPAKICVTGLDNSRDGRRGDNRGNSNWERLGCQKVGFLVDRDIIVVGRREGRFKTIRLEASGNSVYMMDLKVIYANGAPDDIPVRSEIRDGGFSGPLDLKGRDRAIQRIEMVYRAKPSLKGSAMVCVSGR
jgi:hypothetical protein